MSPLGSRSKTSLESHPRREYLDETLALLWPSPGDVGQRDRRWSSAATHVMVPNGREPTALLPRRPRRVTAGALRGYKAAATTSERAWFHSLSWGARLGLADLMPDRVTIAGASGSAGGGIARYLAESLGEDVFLSLYIGPQRANRKPVLQILSRQGKVIGFAKVAVNALTQSLVRREAEALATLNRTSFQHLVVPELLHIGTWEDHWVLVQGALPTGRRGSASVLHRAMAELAGVDSTEQLPITSSPYWLGLKERVGRLPAGAASSLLAELLGRLEVRASDHEIRLGSWHGDWTPWNMAMLGSRVAVWDWERFESRVPWGFDAVHHSMQGAIVRRRVPPRAAAATVVDEAPQLLSALGLDAGHSQVTALTYLVEIGCRYLHDDVKAAGGRLGDVETWLTPVLSHWLPHVTEG